MTGNRVIKTINRSTQQTSTIGKLRLEKEELKEHRDIRLDRFLILFATAYASGNDRDRVGQELHIVVDFLADLDDQIKAIDRRMAAIYDGKIEGAA
ncbi:MAG: hypothetical protein LBC35_02520 [Coriobacteriales bacterium]|jgi:hypothetical protein|nr:hypothetical protein [Coriobacteriales bacterium]